MMQLGEMVFLKKKKKTTGAGVSPTTTVNSQKLEED